MRILIVGAGVAGLSLAALLEKNGFKDYDIVEKTPEIKNIGFALYLFPMGVKVIQELGLKDEIFNDMNPLEYHKFCDAKGKEIIKMDFSSITMKSRPAMPVTRVALQMGLLDKINKERLILGTEIKKLTQLKTLVKVEFSNGINSQYDLVIGADGIKSPLRTDNFPNAVMKYYGWTSWVMWVDNNLVPRIPSGSVELMGSKGYFVLYPINKKKALAYFAAPAVEGFPDQFVTAGEKSLRELKLKKQFEKFGWVVPRILEKIDESNTMYHSDIYRIISNEWYMGRILLIGDAMHGGSPITGLGASMALEDSFVLVEELKKMEEDNLTVEQLLENFVKRRNPRIAIMRGNSDGAMSFSANYSELLTNIKLSFLKRVAPIVPMHYRIKALAQLSESKA